MGRNAQVGTDVSEGIPDTCVVLGYSTNPRPDGELDAAADRKASVPQVNAIHENVKFTAITKAVQAELEDLASLLGLDAVEGTRR